MSIVATAGRVVSEPEITYGTDGSATVILTVRSEIYSAHEYTRTVFEGELGKRATQIQKDDVVFIVGSPTPKAWVNSDGALKSQIEVKVISFECYAAEGRL